MIKTIGIIGGGQLALMLVQSASKFGIDCICLDPNPNAVAFKYCKESINENYSDLKALKLLESKVDTILFEFENVDLQALEQIDQNKIYSPLSMLALSKNRIIEKEFAKKNGFTTPNFYKVDDETSLKAAIEKIGYGGILKTCELGYDGKGQIHLKDEKDIPKALELIHTECIYEQKINFDFEISTIAIRSKQDDLEVFPTFINTHINGILHRTDLDNPPNNYLDLFEKARLLIKTFMEKNNFYGILCIEMFVKDTEIYFNEMAPRPHNSGHITLDATNISQFDQLIRAACNYKLITPTITTPMSMINILGQHLPLAYDLLQQDKELLTYIYGKDKAQPNRKMGHINITNKNLINKIDKEFKNVK